MVAKTGVIHDLNVETLSHIFPSRQSQIEEELQQIEVTEHPMDWELDTLTAKPDRGRTSAY